MTIAACAQRSQWDRWSGPNCDTPEWAPLRDVLGRRPVSRTPEGFPLIPYEALASFLRDVPHLFRQGDRVLSRLEAVATEVATAVPSDDAVVAAAFAQVVRSANVAAPADLWMVRHVMVALTSVGVVGALRSGDAVRPGQYTAAGIDPVVLEHDLSLLLCRGYLTRRRDGAYVAAGSPAAIGVLACDWRANDGLAEVETRIAEGLDGLTSAEAGRMSAALARLDAPAVGGTHGWVAGPDHVRLGSWLLPVVVGLGPSAAAAVPGRPIRAGHPAVDRLLALAGLIDGAAVATALGRRVLSRGPGPMGIVHSYAAMMHQHERRLRGEGPAAAVDRVRNVCACDQANRGMFASIIASVAAFAANHRMSVEVLIEHACGACEAIRQHWRTTGDTRVRYVAADLDPAAVHAGLAAWPAGERPPLLTTLAPQDIGRPADLLEALRTLGIPTRQAVMIVGNGFHEIRGQTDDSIIGTFRAYAHAGIILVFTEETLLSSEQIRSAGWNTYHAAFRHCHWISGQHLRPQYDVAEVGPTAAPMPLSWPTCLLRGGYVVLPHYSKSKRRLLPCPEPDDRNPAISVSYFCVPSHIAAQLGIGLVNADRGSP